MHHAYVNTRPCRSSRSDAGQMPAEKILSILCLVGLLAPHIEGAEGFLAQENL